MNKFSQILHIRTYEVPTTHILKFSNMYKHGIFHLFPKNRHSHTFTQYFSVFEKEKLKISLARFAHYRPFISSVPFIFVHFHYHHSHIQTPRRPSQIPSINI